MASPWWGSGGTPSAPRVFNIGFSEMLVICLVLIIVVGPERLPSMMKTVGKAIRSVRQASRDIQTTVGLDELWREDVLNPPPPPPALAPPPAAVVSRESPESVPRVSLGTLTPVTPQLPPIPPPPAGPSSPPDAPVVPAAPPEPPVPAAAAGGGKGEA